MSAITFESLAIAEQRLQLTRTTDNQFFPEWQGALPELEVTEQASLDPVHQRYLYQ
ncbi:MAG: hypothetical protein F6J87_30150 [Spirulina sp. SIO3F2]|nr:hypothetical protein [Spirulina sp. SIO3F2]